MVGGDGPGRQSLISLTILVIHYHFKRFIEQHNE